MKKIIIAMPTMGDIPTQTMMYLYGMQKPKDYEVSIVSTIRSPIMLARNELIKQAMMSKADYVRFLDDDNPPESPNALEILLSKGKDIISGLVPSRQPDGEGNHRLCVFQDGQKPSGEHYYNQYINLPKEKDFEISNCGCGCVLVAIEPLRKVYEKYQGYPCEMKYMRYYKTPTGDISEDDIDVYKLDDGIIRYRKYISEDVLLFERIKRLGYKIRATSDVQCKHLGNNERISIKEHITARNKDKGLLLNRY